jgi:hypothetical protein
MANETMHVSDPDLLRAIDGEVEDREAALINEHLKACWKCRGRHAEMERTITHFVAAHASNAAEELPAIEGPRALLRARMAQLQSESPRASWLRWPRLAFSVQRPVFAALGLCVALMIGLMTYSGIREVRAASVPDASLTPGATRAVERGDICSAAPREDVHPVSATLARQVFEQYRIRNPQSGLYEMDYLITPALGGADDIRNLWPQPYASGEWNAHVKDALEDYLYIQVCGGKLNLREAQRDIAANWIAAYRKYFQTDRPLQIHRSFSIDPAWSAN